MKYSQTVPDKQRMDDSDVKRVDVSALHRWVHLKVNEHPSLSEKKKADNLAKKVTVTRRLEVLKKTKKQNT